MATVAAHHLIERKVATVDVADRLAAALRWAQGFIEEIDGPVKHIDAALAAHEAMERPDA